VEKYMQSRLGKLKPGDDVGVFSHELPSRPRPGVPAPMPDDGNDLEDTEITDNEEGEEEEETDDDDEVEIPDNGWSIVRKKGGKFYLNNKDPNIQNLELAQAEGKGKWEVFTKGGVQYLWQGKEVEDEVPSMACSDFYNEGAEATVAHLNATPPALRGMARTRGLDLFLNIKKIDWLSKLRPN